MVVGVIKNGKIIYHQVEDYANLEKKPLTDD